jgi:hypothetical protein
MGTCWAMPPYVNSLTCNATGSYQRDDTPYSRAFLNQFLNP